MLEIFDLKLLKEGYYPSYNEKTNGQAANAFATAAFRFGHSLVQGKFLKWDGIRQQAFSSKLLKTKCYIYELIFDISVNKIIFFKDITLHEELNDPARLHRFGAVDGLLLGMCLQESQRRDEHITEELTNHLFETPSKLKIYRISKLL